jgi:thiamine-monophosphate kinase
MLSACREYRCQIIGGDLVRSPVTFITVAMTGVAQGPILTRHGAQPGDVIAVTGHLGCSAGGLRAYTQGLNLEGAVSEHLHSAHVHPLPRLQDGQAIAQAGVRAAMDISDGLTDDLSKLCISSGVGAIVYAQKVPVDAFLQEAFPQDCLQLALNGGEEYELLFTGSEEVVSRAMALLAPSAAILGRIVAEHPGLVRVLDERGGDLQMDRRGWDHFK